MQQLFKGATVYRKGKLSRSEIVISGERIVRHLSGNPLDGVSISSLEDKLLIPGLVDVHVHLREPGFSYKETIKAGSLAAARGGYTAVCAMPNLLPAPDCVEHILEEQKLIDRDACLHVYPYATITKEQKGEGELVDFKALAPYAIAYSDDGRGVQSKETMREAMRRVKEIGSLLVAHCEDNALLRGGYIHAGEYAKAHGHKGINSESEWRQVERDLQLSKETGCRYHVCHVSAKESVALIRKAKQEGVDVTCETAPHYLLLDDSQLEEDGRFKMNPPIRGKADQDALIEGLLDGTIDMVATDHAPHSTKEKSQGLKGSVMGVVGLECAFSVLYTGLVKTGKLPLDRLLYAMTDAPRKRFGLPQVDLEEGQPADIAVFDLAAEYQIDSNEFVSLGRASPFEGMRVFGRCKMTIVGGKTVWQRN